ncbi:MAG: hypothetical protein JWR80_3932 [Bradyrhizobium sp.]|nr:hypothetical protein [Bradyrhizobium sp.]
MLVDRLAHRTFTILAVCIASTAAQAQTPRYQLDSANNEVVSVSGLAEISATNCGKGSARGIIAKREFDESGLVPTGLVLEVESGARTFMNIDTSALKKSGVPRLDATWIINGLQTLTRIGRPVTVRFSVCGSGAFHTVEGIAANGR